MLDCMMNFFFHSVLHHSTNPLSLKGRRDDQEMFRLRYQRGQYLVTDSMPSMFLATLSFCFGRRVLATVDSCLCFLFGPCTKVRWTLCDLALRHGGAEKGKHVMWTAVIDCNTASPSFLGCVSVLAKDQSPVTSLISASGYIGAGKA